MIEQYTKVTHYPAVDLSSTETIQGKFNLIIELVDKVDRNITGIYLRNGYIHLEIDEFYDYDFDLKDFVYYDESDRGFHKWVSNRIEPRTKFDSPVVTIVQDNTGDN